MTDIPSSARAPAVAPSWLARVRGAPITCALTAVNATVFLIAESGGSTTDSLRLIRFGADEATIVWTGDAWRLATSMFLHIGWAHLLWNTYASWGWCEATERALGRSRFLATYLVAGIGGSCASVLAQHVVSAGASGAMFGIVGATLVLGRRASADWRAFFASPATRSTLRNSAIWFALGATAVRMDNFAHLGGLITGVAVTTLLTSRAPTGRSAAILALLTSMFFVVGSRPWHQTPTPVELVYLDWYGRAYAHGHGVVRDERRADSFLRLACKYDSASGCGALGDLLRARRTPEAETEALALFRKARGLYMKECDKGSKWACDTVRGIEATDASPP